VKEWGEEVWVHQVGGGKLGGRAKKGRRIGYDNESNGSRIWYPDTSAVKIERSFRFVVENRSDLEGERASTNEIRNDLPLNRKFSNRSKSIR
jgi:hypothetical protein